MDDTDIFVIEVRDEYKRWNFSNNGVITEIQKCEYCSRTFVKLDI